MLQRPLSPATERVHSSLLSGFQEDLFERTGFNPLPYRSQWNELPGIPSQSILADRRNSVQFPNLNPCSPAGDGHSTQLVQPEPTVPVPHPIHPQGVPLHVTITTEPSPRPDLPLLIEAVPVQSENLPPTPPSHTCQSPKAQSPVKKLSQGQVIWKFFKLGKNNTQSACDLFNKEQRDEMLWMALHGIPSPGVAYILTTGTSAVQPPPGKNKKVFVPSLEYVVNLCVPVLAMGCSGREDPDGLIEYLLGEATSKFWSPLLLKQAVDHVFIKDDGGGGAKKERQRNATERKAATKYKWKHGEGPANVDWPARKKAEVAAAAGVFRDAAEDESIEELFGYCEDNQDGERELMKKWLLKIRELGRLLSRDEFDESTV